MLIMPLMSDDFHQREREHDHYRRQRERDHYHDRRERDHYRRKKERERDASADASAEVVYNPLAAAMRVAVFVAALWLILAVISMPEQIAYDWWRSVFGIAAVIALLGLGREFILCVIASFRARTLAMRPIIGGLAVGLMASVVLQFAGVMGLIAEVLINVAPAY